MRSVPYTLRAFPSLSLAIMRFSWRRFAAGVLDRARKCIALLLVYATVAGTMPVRAGELATIPNYAPSPTRQLGLSNTVDGAWPLRSGHGEVGTSQNGARSELVSEKQGSSVAGDSGSLSEPVTANAALTSAAGAAPSVGLKTAVIPVFECVVNNGEDAYEAWFGYQNDNDTGVIIPVGADNRFTSTPEERGQASTFLPGRQRFIFSTPLDGSSLVWSLQGPDNTTHTAAASWGSPRCAPLADAGSPQTVNVGRTVQLDGTTSSDYVGLPLTYKWKFLAVPNGSSASLSDSSTVRPTFTADRSGTYVLQLVVNNGKADSEPSTVTITTLNSVPLANAGPNQTVHLDATVQLDGSGSTDVDGDSLTHHWSLISGPKGSSARLSSADVVNPSFVADVNGVYAAQLIVNDGHGNSAPETVIVSTINSAPVANAGPNRSVVVGKTVELDGSASTDVDGDRLTYRWSLLSVPTGSNAVLSNTKSVKPTFLADLAGTYVAQLIVNDGWVSSPPDTVTITTGETAPIADAGAAETVRPGSLVNLDGSGSFSLAKRSLTYEWSLLSRPTDNNGVGSYTYDAVGNRKTLNTTIPPAGGNSYTYDADDRLGSDQYDADGNTINSLGTANSYDFENHMIAHGAVTVVYDGDGNRVSETVGGVTTSYLVDTANPTGYAQVVDEVQSGTVTRTYAYGLERISENQKISSAWTPSFYGYDGHGSVRQLTNTVGAVTDIYDHDAFGNLVSSTGTTPNVYLFAGEAYDSALGLYYNRARYLNTTTGRFWSMDTYKGDKWRPTTLHRYSYAWNNPPNVVDPSGLDGDIATEEVTETVGVVEDTMPVVETAPIIEAFEEPEVVAEAPQVASGFQKAVAYLLLGAAALGTAAGVGGTGNQVPIDQEVAEASQGNYDIYRLGNSTKLYDLRQGADYTLNTQGLIDPQNPAMNSDYRGASAFRDPWFRPWPKYPTGYAYRIPLQAIYDANGLGVIPDAAKFAPDVPVGAGHHTIYPTEQMTPQDLDQRIRSLPWVITPPRIK